MAKNNEGNAYKHWSAAAISQLRFMAQNDFSTKSIAKNLDRSTDSIYAKASQIGQTLKPRDK